MKRKMRLLVAAVLTMTMVMGMSISVSAKTIVPSANEVFYLEDVAPGTVFDTTALRPEANGIIFKLKSGGTFTILRNYQAGKVCSLHFIKDGEDAPKYPHTHVDYNVEQFIIYDQTWPVITNQFYEKSGDDYDDEEFIDRDTFKSEAPSKTVIASDTLGAKQFFDLKVHSADEKTITNQELLVQSLIKPNIMILLTENIYPRRDLSITENGSLQIFTRNNLPKNQAGPVYAVVYNQIDGAYVINGVLDANGTATFTGFKLRPASTITICK